MAKWGRKRKGFIGFSNIAALLAFLPCITARYSILPYPETVLVGLAQGFLSVGITETTKCHEVSAINCDTHYVPDGDERVCSSDMKDCPTLCHFAQKKCKDPSLTILGLGPCSLIRTSESPSTSPTTSDPIDTTTSDPPIDSTSVTSDPSFDPIGTTDDPPPTILSTILKVSHHTTMTATTPKLPQHTTLPQHANCTDVICSVFCSQADTITCPKDLDPVCGTDGKFYTNDCVFAKAKCKDINLDTQDLVLCKTNRRHRRELEFV